MEATDCRGQQRCDGRYFHRDPEVLSLDQGVSYDKAFQGQSFESTGCLTDEKSMGCGNNYARAGSLLQQEPDSGFDSGTGADHVVHYHGGLTVYLADQFVSTHRRPVYPSFPHDDY